MDGFSHLTFTAQSDSGPATFGGQAKRNGTPVAVHGQWTLLPWSSGFRYVGSSDLAARQLRDGMFLELRYGNDVDVYRIQASRGPALDGSYPSDADKDTLTLEYVGKRGFKGDAARRDVKEAGLWLAFNRVSAPMQNVPQGK